MLKEQTIPDRNQETKDAGASLADDVDPAGGADDGVPEGWLPEFWHNPFTRPLGPPLTGAQLLELLEVLPPHAEHERRLSHTLRRYALLRLYDVIVPLERHVQYAERLGMVIRQGYKARNPAKGLHRAAFLASSAAVQGLNAGATFEDASAMMPEITHSQAVGFALLGDPGMSKTTTTNRVLSSFPQVVEPELPYYVKQLVWLKVECPSKGGRKQWCIAVLNAIDKALNTRYAKLFGAESKRMAGDTMMLYVQHLVTLHAVGVIVVDEIQCAMQSSEGSAPLMNFLVGLVNMLGVPLVLIGTNEARPVINGSFRQARRGTGLGQPNWFRMERGEEWEDWLAEIWKYQWTQVHTPMTDAIGEAIYDESQGIIDIAVKLVILGQMRAIDRNELMGASEVMDAGLLRAVAKDEFKLIAPMIKALREGRDDILATYSDLQPFHDHVERLLCQSTNRTMKELQTLRDLRERVAAAKADAAQAPWLPIKAKVLQLGYAEEVADRVIAEAIKSNSIDDIFGISLTVNDLLTKEEAPRAKPAPAPNRKSRTAKPAEGSLAAVSATAEDAVAALRASGDVKAIEDLAP